MDWTARRIESQSRISEPYSDHRLRVAHTCSSAEGEAYTVDVGSIMKLNDLTFVVVILRIAMGEARTPTMTMAKVFRKAALVCAASL
eukprot:1414627-Pleurochrysis_carterae.AAC.2